MNQWKEVKASDTEAFSSTLENMTYDNISWK